MTARTPVRQAYVASARTGQRVLPQLSTEPVEGGPNKPASLSICSHVTHAHLTSPRDPRTVPAALERQMPTTGAGVAVLVPPRPLAAPPAAPTRPVGRPRRTRLRPGRLRGLVDPVVVGLVSLVVYALHGYNGNLGRDLALFTYGGEHVAKGVPPYVGVFNSVGPLADAVPGLAVWLGHLVDVGPLLAIRVLFTLLSALCCAMLCVLARDTFGSRAAGLVAPAIFLTFERFLELASDGPREKTTMVVFLLATLILAGRRRWLAAGVFTALATLTWQPVFLVALAAVAVAIVTGGRHRTGSFVRFLVGGAIPSALTVVWFVLAHALRIAWNGFFVVNVGYTKQPSAISQPGLIWSKLWGDFHVTLLVALVGLAVLLVLSARALPFVRRSAGVVSPVPHRLVSVGAGCLVGCGWTIAVINGGPDLFELLPFAALGVAGAAVLAAAHLPRGLGTAAVTTLVCAGVVVGTVESVATRDDGLLLERADISAVLGTQPPDATILSMETPQVLAIAGRDNIWRWQMFDPRMLSFLDHTQPGGLRAMAHRLEVARPTFLAIATRYDGTWQRGVVRRDYWRVGHAPGWTWYLSRTTGRDALDRARTANASVMAASTGAIEASPTA
jgi:hypothetical protein